MSRCGRWLRAGGALGRLSAQCSRQCARMLEARCRRSDRARWQSSATATTERAVDTRRAGISAHCLQRKCTALRCSIVTDDRVREARSRESESERQTCAEQPRRVDSKCRQQRGGRRIPRALPRAPPDPPSESPSCSSEQIRTAVSEARMRLGRRSQRSDPVVPCCTLQCHLSTARTHISKRQEQQRRRAPTIDAPILEAAIERMRP